MKTPLLGPFIYTDTDTKISSFEKTDLEQSNIV